MMSVCTCGQLDEFLKEGKVQIQYSPRFREYSIKLENSQAVQSINFCPWCGDKLPEPLGNRWFDELEAMGFDEPFKQSGSDPDFPEAYKTDAWWKLGAQP